MGVPFLPATAKTVNIAVAAASARVAIPGLATGTSQVRVYNAGSAIAWVEFGDVTITAAVATGIPIPPGAIEVLTIPQVSGAPYVAAIAAGATGSIYFTPGMGV